MGKWSEGHGRLRRWDSPLPASPRRWPSRVGCSFHPSRSERIYCLQTTWRRWHAACVWCGKPPYIGKMKRIYNEMCNVVSIPLKEAQFGSFLNSRLWIIQSLYCFTAKKSTLNLKRHTNSSYMLCLASKISWCHWPAAVGILGEDADGFVKAGGHKLLPGGRIIHIQHSRDVVHVHHDWLLQIPHVIRVQAAEKTHVNTWRKALRAHKGHTSSTHL